MFHYYFQWFQQEFLQIYQDSFRSCLLWYCMLFARSFFMICFTDALRNSFRSFSEKLHSNFLRNSLRNWKKVKQTYLFVFLKIFLQKYIQSMGTFRKFASNFIRELLRISFLISKYFFVNFTKDFPRSLLWYSSKNSFK